MNPGQNPEQQGWLRDLMERFRRRGIDKEQVNKATSWFRAPANNGMAYQQACARRAAKNRRRVAGRLARAQRVGNDMKRRGK